LNIIDKAIDDAMFVIPEEILDLVFRRDNRWKRATPISVREAIMQDVMRPRVLVDANIVGGKETVISLLGLDPFYTDDHCSVYKVPEERLNFKTILSVHSVGFVNVAVGSAMSYSGTSSLVYQGQSEMLPLANQVMDAAGSIPDVATARAELVDENTFVVYDRMRNNFIFNARVVLCNNDDLSNIHIRSAPKFSKLAEYAIKAHIYKKLQIRLNRNQLEMGQDLPAIKDYVDSLSDSNENYQTYLSEVWQKVAFMNDRRAFRRFMDIAGPRGI